MKESILISGASSGIGRALAFEFSKRGYALGLCARRVHLLESLRNELPSETPVAIARVDLSRSDDIHKVFINLAKELGNVKIVIANAGVSEKSFPGDGTFYLGKKVIDINLLGAMATIDVGTEI